MKLILIKIGKAIHTIQRDGIFRGGKRVISAFFALFRKVGSGDVLFITGGVGDSARYRTEHVAEELEMHGIKSSITVQDNPMLASYADKFSVFIFHRTLHSPSVEKLVIKIKKLGKEIIFDTDDLVFDPKYLEHMDFFKKMNVFEKKLYENGVGGEILRDPYVKLCTTSTAYLGKKLEEEGKRVFVVHNKLPESDIEIIEKIKEKNLANYYFPRERMVLGYFSGAHGHDKDFSTIEDVLIKIMDKFDDVRLFIGGPLEISKKFDKYEKRILRKSYVPREDNFRNIAGIDINLAPLEIGNPFCEAKSELKFFEAGILGVPTVAVGNMTFGGAIEDGVDGFLAKTEDEWFEKIEKLIINSNIRKEIGENAKKKVWEKYTNRNSGNQEYYNYLKSKIK